MNRVKLGSYRNNVSFVKYCYERSCHKDLSKLTSEISASFPIPCIIVASFLKEIVGDTAEANELIAFFMKEYAIDEVIE